MRKYDITSPPPAPGIPTKEEDELLKEPNGLGPNPFAATTSIPRPAYGFYPHGPGPQYPVHYPYPPVQYPYPPAPREECKQCREREGKLRGIVKQINDLLGDSKVRGASFRDMGLFPLPEPDFQGF